MSNIWNKLETGVVVTIIACLIWLYAEDENVRDFPNEQVDVRFVAPPGRDLVIEPSTPVRVSVNFRGASGQFAQLKKTLENKPVELVVTDNPSNPDPKQVMILKDLLGAYKPIADTGVSVLDVQPTTMDVRVERLEKVEMPITVNAGGVELSGPATIEPAKASLLLPSSLAVLISQEKIEANLADVPDVATLSENISHTVDVPLRLPLVLQGSSFKAEPAIAKVTFTVRKRTDTARLDTVPILLMIPPGASRTHSVELAETERLLRDIELSGPRDIIEKISRKEVEVYATLRLTADELDSNVKSKLVHIVVPQGVTVVSPIPRVNFTITKPAVSE